MPVDILPPATRLALILPDIERVADRAAQERTLRLGNEQAIREALMYAPPFAKEIVQDLSRTRILLNANGFIPEKKKDELAQAVDEELKDYRYMPRLADPLKTAREAMKRIAWTVHPDVADASIAEAFSEAERVDAYTTSIRMAEAGEAEKAQQLLIETMPKLYLHQIRDKLAQGMGFAEIVAQNPELVPEMENVRWIARRRLPDERAYRGNLDPKTVEEKARDIRRKKEFHARTSGYVMIYEVVEDVMRFAQSKGLTPVGYASENLLRFMEEASRYVGGTGEFVLQRGKWVETYYAETLAKKMEEFIRALPHAVHYLAEVAVVPDTTTEAFNKALEQLRVAVASVRSSAERYGQELVNRANRRTTPVIELGSSFSEISKININFKNY